MKKTSLGPRGALTAQTTTAEETVLTLQRQLALHRNVQAMTATGGWELDLSSDTLYWTPETFRIHDLWPGEFLPTRSSMLLFYEPRDQVRIQLALVRAARFGIPFDFELRMTTAEKRTLPVRLAGNVDIDGLKPSRLYGVVQDLGASSRGVDVTRFEPTTPTPPQAR